MDDHDESTANVGMNNIALAIRDKVRELRRKYPYSDAMMGTIDPYSGQPIRNREDYEDYLISYASAPFTQWNNPVIFSGKTSQPVDVSKAPLDRSKADPLPQNNSPDTELPTKSHRITWPQIKLIAGKEEAMVFDNPFYVLSALPCDDRKRIIQLCDEKSLLQNADKCIEARNTLINPQKRLSAEVRWFMGCQSSAIIELLAHLVQYRDGVAIERKLDVTLNPILNLNYNLAIFVYSASRENELIPVRIVEICSVFNKIDPVAVMLLINDSRKEANIPQLNNKSDVEAALNNLRDDIKNIVTKVFTSLPQQNVTSILTTIMSVNDGHKSINGSVIMEDLIAWYALYTHDLEDEMNQDVLLELKTIENSQDSKNLKTQLETLIAHIRNWNNLVTAIYVVVILISIGIVALFNEMYYSIPTEFISQEFRSAIGAPATSEQTVKPTTSKPTTKPISIPTAKIVRMFEVTKPANGSASYYTGNAAKDTSVGITVPSGKNFYLITLADAKTNKKAVKIFVYPGETVNTEIPSGTYRLYYTYGDKWYGIIDEFGPDAVKFRSKESDTFSSNSGGWDYTLKPVTYGNMQTEEVNASDYPI